MGGRKIRVHSRITAELPPEVQREVDRLLVEGDATYDDIRDFLARKGYDISRSAIGRYGKEFLANYRRLRIVEDKSRVLVSEAGDGMVLEEAASKIFAQMILEAQLSGELDIKELPRIISDFARLQASSILRERMKKEFEKKVEKTADKVEETARREGVSPETIQKIRRDVLLMAT